ncbi:MAG TPA: hypothetical protein VN088_16190 [Nocardioides sp.]|nr:hypothetical protein [Nocardioides sp.]
MIRGVELALLAALDGIDPATLRQTVRRHAILPVAPGLYDPLAIARHRRHAALDCARCADRAPAPVRGRRVADIELLSRLLGVSTGALRKTIQRHAIHPVRRGVYDVDDVSRHRRHADESCGRCLKSCNLKASDRTP